jgi:hypothetical protein
MLVIEGDMLPSLYLLTLFVLEQFRFLEIQEAYAFEIQQHPLKHNATAVFVPPRSDSGEISQAGRGFDCAICQLEPIGWVEQVYTLGCKHQFHRWCLIYWLHHMENTTCPLCRDTILDPPNGLPNQMAELSLAAQRPNFPEAGSEWVTEGPQYNQRRHPPAQAYVLRQRTPEGGAFTDGSYRLQWNDFHDPMFHLIDWT